MRSLSRRIVAATIFLFVIWTLRHCLPGNDFHSPLLSTRRKQIEAAFEHAWEGYSTHCFGHDFIHPVSNTCNDNLGGFGATAFDALSTAIMFRNEKVVLQILGQISEKDFTHVVGGDSIQVFEVTIRILGGMVSSFDLLNGPYSDVSEDEDLRHALYSQMTRLGAILSCAFDTPTGIPRNWVNPVTCSTDDATSNTVAGVGTLILELARLSDVTGDSTYASLAQRAEEYLLYPHPSENEVFPGILGSFVSVLDGSLIDAQGSWGALADSFYEYLLKAYMYNQETYQRYLDHWLLAVDSTIQYIASSAYGIPETAFLPYWQDQHLSNAMDSLSWFAGGNIILGGIVTGNQSLIDFGLRIADTAGLVYSSTATGLGGEYVVWSSDCEEKDMQDDLCAANHSFAFSSTAFNLRPEVIETWYYAYRATRDVKYREMAWNVFIGLEEFCKTRTGYSAISNVSHSGGGQKLDEQDSFLFAEVLKYLWLIHSDDETLPVHVQDSRLGKGNSWILNTEAHPIRVAGRPV